MLVLSLPFYLAGSVASVRLLPGLPISALGFVCPGTAALILVYRERQRAGVLELLKRSFDHRRIRPAIWYVPIFLLEPGILVLSYGVMTALGVPLPTPEMTILSAAGLFLVFVIPALAEELGWSGYVIEPMQERLGALHAAIVLGLVGAAWHIIPLLQVGRSPGWIAGWCLETVAKRVLIVWLFNSAGHSVLAATLFHAMGNVCWLLFPVQGSSYDPRVSGPITACVAVLVAVVWGPRTLVRFRITSPASSRSDGR